MRGSRSMTCIGRRRSCSREKGGNVRVGLADGRTVPLTGPRNALRGLKLHDAVYVRLTETKGGQGQGQHRPCGTPGTADGAGRRGGAGEPDRAHPGDGRRLFLSAEPAQPGDAIAAPAGLGDQAGQLPGRARARDCSRTRWCATSPSACRRSAAPMPVPAPRITGRRGTMTAAAAGS